MTVEGRAVELRAWRYVVLGVAGHSIPVYLLDSSLPDNDAYDQTLTDSLYGGDARYRLCQEVVLGIGGIAMLRALGHSDIHTYHMNEGHSSLLTLALLQEHAQDGRHGALLRNLTLRMSARSACSQRIRLSMPGTTASRRSSSRASSAGNVPASWSG